MDSPTFQNFTNSNYNQTSKIIIPIILIFFAKIITKQENLKVMGM